MKGKQLKSIIDKYAKNECTPEEEILFNRFMNSFQNNEKGWNEKKLGDKKETGKQLLTKITHTLDNKPTKRKPYIRKYTHLIKIAASIIIVLSISTTLLYLDGYFGKAQSTAQIEKITQPGQKSIVTLFDGTTIILNADSRLKFPKNFNNQTREVYLQGEAYFEVTHNPSKPFIVHTNAFTMVDLGTAFDVKAFPNDTNFEVSLVSGKLSVNRNNANQYNEDILLSPDQQYSFNKINGKETIGNFDLTEVIGWKDNILKFNDKSLSQVFEELHRAYGIKFELVDKSSSNFKITANFRGDSFHTILEVIKKLSRLEYRTEGENNVIQKVVYYKNFNNKIK